LALVRVSPAAKAGDAVKQTAAVRSEKVASRGMKLSFAENGGPPNGHGSYRRNVAHSVR
jgi:hypothetical protein